MNIKTRNLGLAAIILTLMLSTAAYADVVWPALYLETRLFSWWAIGLGLIVEFLLIYKIFSLPVKKALICNLAANAASTLLGVILIPLAGIVWEVFPGLVFYNLLNVGTFNPVTWGATFLFACLINAWLENTVLKRFFKLPFNRKTFLWLALANGFSVGIAFASLWLKPPEM